MRAASVILFVAPLLAPALAGCGRVSGATERTESNAASPSALSPTMMRMDEIGMAGGRGLFIARRDAGETRIPFDVPLDRVAPERRHDMERVGETGAGVVVVIDRYATRPAADPRCADGRESFVRVFSLPLRRQIMAQPLESCRDRIAVAEPAVTWLAGGGFRIEGGAPRTFQIRGTDEVVPAGRGAANG